MVKRMLVLCIQAYIHVHTHTHTHIYMYNMYMYKWYESKKAMYRNTIMTTIQYFVKNYNVDMKLLRSCHSEATKRNYTYTH